MKRVDIYKKKCIECGSMFDRSIFKGEIMDRRNYIRKCETCEPLGCSICKLPYTVNNIVYTGTFKTYYQDCKCINVNYDIDLNKLIVTDKRDEIIDIKYNGLEGCEWIYDRKDKRYYLTKDSENYQSVRFYPNTPECKITDGMLSIYTPRYLRRKCVIIGYVFKKLDIFPVDIIKEIIKNIMYKDKLLILYSVGLNDTYRHETNTQFNEAMWNILVTNNIKEKAIRYILINTGINL
uniref:Uncharacterized protein n=1 Tax=viral metagenome TaxID=1070528 RepID=A0A6C0LKV2_9ZZZZ